MKKGDIGNKWYKTRTMRVLFFYIGNKGDF